MPFDSLPEETKTLTKPGVFSLDGLIAWLERQPADTQYDWNDCDGGCLIGLYGLSMGLGDDWRGLHSHFSHEGLLRVACRTPHTFGAALKRARALRSAASVRE